MEQAPEAERLPQVQWKWQYLELKKRFLSLQHKTLELAKAYEHAADEWQLQRECQQVLVDKYAQIRVRRMRAFRNAPMDGRMLFMEESKHTVRQMHPLATRKDIREYLTKEWTNLPTQEQDLWHEKLKTIQAQQFKHPSTPAKNRRKTGTAGAGGGAAANGPANKATPSKRKSAALKASSNPTGAAVKRRKTNATGRTPATSSAPPKNSPRKPRAPNGTGSRARKDKKATTKGPRAAAAVAVAKSSHTSTKGSTKDDPQTVVVTATAAATELSSSMPSSTTAPADVLATPTKPAKVTKRKRQGSPGSRNASPARAQGSAKRRKTPVKKARKLQVGKLLASPVDDDNEEVPTALATPNAGRGGVLRIVLSSEDDEEDDDLEDDDEEEDEDDDDDEEDDDDDDNGASGSDEDSDEQLAHLPTGAFG